MSLDIALLDKKTGEEIADMNWLRNPFGLCNWAEGSVSFTPAERKSLWYVVNNWNYEKARRVNRKLFLEVVLRYNEEIQNIEQGLFYFGYQAFLQFVYHKGRTLPLEKNKFIGVCSIKGAKWRGDKLGLPMEYFKLDISAQGDVLVHYKRWFAELVQFAKLLQDERYKFYCTN
jgi:hypothetical protein